MHVEVTPVSYEELAKFERTSEPSATIVQRVEKARVIQNKRFEDFNQIFSNAQMSSNMVRDVCTISNAGTLLLKNAMKKLQLSARAYDRILKVARTCADLSDSKSIEIEHLAEAIHFRSLDREDWLG